MTYRRTLTRDVLEQNVRLRAENDKLKTDRELVLDEYYHLLHTSNGTVRAEHEPLCRKYRDVLKEREELYVIRDEHCELRSRVARGELVPRERVTPMRNLLPQNVADKDGRRTTHSAAASRSDSHRPGLPC